MFMYVISAQGCYDDDPLCRTIGDDVCKAPLTEFGRQHCGVFCEFCSKISNETMTTTTSSPTDVCPEDDLSCRTLGDKVCKPPLEDFGRRKCSRFCEFCVGPTTTAEPTTTSEAPTTTTEAPTTTTVAVTEAPTTTTEAPTKAPTEAPTTTTEAATTTAPPATPPAPTTKTPGRTPTTPEKTPAPTTPVAEYTGHPIFSDCNKTAEVVFVLDSSSSVGRENFLQMVEYTENVTRSLKTEYERLNVTVIKYSNEAEVALKLNESVSLTDMINAESTINYGHGGTATHKALQLMTQQFNPLVNNPKIAVVITDGSSFNPTLTALEAQAAKKNGVAVFVIGVGEDVNPQELKVISSDPDDKFLFQLTDFLSLNLIVNLFHPKQCTELLTTTTEEPTTTTAAPTTTEAPTPAPTTTTEAPTPAPTTTTVAPTQAPTTTTEAPTPAPTTTEAQTPAPPTTTEAATPAPTTTTEAPTPAPTTTEAQTPAPTTTTEAPTPAPTTTEAQTPAPTTTEAPTQAPTTTEAQTPAPTTTTEAPTPAPTTTEAQTPAPTTTTEAPTPAPTTAAPTTAAPTTTTEVPTPYVAKETTTNAPTTTEAQTPAPPTTTEAQTPAPTTTTAAQTPAPTTAAPTTTTEVPTPAPTTTEAKTPAPTTTEAQTPAPTTTTAAPTPAPTTAAPTTTTEVPTPYIATQTTTKAPTTTEAQTPAPPTTTEAPTPAPTTTTEAPTPAPTTTEAQTPAPTTTTEAQTPAPTTAAPTTTTEAKTPAPTTTEAQTPAPPTTTEAPTPAPTTTAAQTPAPTTTEAPTPAPTTAAATTTSEVPTPYVGKETTTEAPTTEAPTPAPTTTTETPTTAVPITSTLPQVTTTASCIAKVADVVFVVDASGSIGVDNFLKVKQFIKDVINWFDVAPAYTRVALIKYSTTAQFEFKFNNLTTGQDLLNTVDQISYSGGGTTTSDALRLLRSEGFEGERPDAPDIAIVITDGLSKYPLITRAQADLAKQEGITMFSIGIGNLTDTNELLAIASDKQYMTEVGDFDTLLKLDSIIAHRACGVVLPEGHYTRSTPAMTSPATECVDISPDCASYPRDSCTDFEPYARKNCARTCGYCPGFPIVEPPCEDKLDNCGSYSSDMCFSPSQYEWVDANCRKFCGFCGNKTEITKPTEPPTTVAPVSECKNKLENCGSYNSDICTNPSYKFWARDNCAKFCYFCYNYHTIPSQTVHKQNCPEWVLPEECTLEYNDNSCCPFPVCQPGFRLTIQRE
ncbi:biological adhesion [Mactra antiquata]